MSDLEELQLVHSNEILELFGNLQTTNTDMVIDTVAPLTFPTNGELRTNEICFYKIKQLSYDEDYPRREAFVRKQKIQKRSWSLLCMEWRNW